MSVFGGTSFKVRVTSDGFFPAPARDSDGIPRYRAEISIIGAANFTLLQDRVERGTPKMVNGAKVCNWHSDSGGGSYTLTVPTHRGATASYTAVLVSLAGSGSGHHAGDPLYFADAEWVILSDITP